MATPPRLSTLKAQTPGPTLPESAPVNSDTSKEKEPTHEGLTSTFNSTFKKASASLSDLIYRGISATHKMMRDVQKREPLRESLDQALEEKKALLENQERLLTVLKSNPNFQKKERLEATINLLNDAVQKILSVEDPIDTDHFKARTDPRSPLSKRISQRNAKQIELEALQKVLMKQSASYREYLEVGNLLVIVDEKIKKIEAGLHSLEEK